MSIEQWSDICLGESVRIEAGGQKGILAKVIEIDASCAPEGIVWFTVLFRGGHKAMYRREEFVKAK